MSLKQHDLGDVDCWCDPTLLRICPVCEPDPPDSEGHETIKDAVGVMEEYADPGCWRCDGNGLLTPPDEWEIHEHRLLVIHNGM